MKSMRLHEKQLLFSIGANDNSLIVSQIDPSGTLTKLKALQTSSYARSMCLNSEWVLLGFREGGLKQINVNYLLTDRGEFNAEQISTYSFSGEKTNQNHLFYDHYSKNLIYAHSKYKQCFMIQEGKDEPKV